MILILLLTNTALTAVTAYELTPASEFVDGKTTVIGTSVAVGHGGGIFPQVLHTLLSRMRFTRLSRFPMPKSWDVILWYRVEPSTTTVYFEALSV